MSCDIGHFDRPYGVYLVPYATSIVYVLCHKLLISYSVCLVPKITSIMYVLCHRLLISYSVCLVQSNFDSVPNYAKKKKDESEYTVALMI